MAFPHGIADDIRTLKDLLKCYDFGQDASSRLQAAPLKRRRHECLHHRHRSALLVHEVPQVGHGTIATL